MNRHRVTIDQANEILLMAPKFTYHEIGAKVSVTYNQVRNFCKKKKIKALNGNIKKTNESPDIIILPSPYVIPGLIISLLTIEQVNAMRKESQCPSLEKIFTEVCNYYSVDKKDVKSKGRKSEWAWARHVYFWLSCRFTKKKLTQIGRLSSGRDHTTVIHGRNTVRDIIKFDKDREREVREISGIVKNLSKNAS